MHALQLRLSNERARLAAATRPGEIAMRKVWVAQIEKEIEQERDEQASGNKPRADRQENSR